MRKLLAATAALTLLLALPASGAPRPKVLGKDAANDAPPGLDLTYLAVTRTGDALDIRIGMNMLPVTGGYPEGPGIQWTFDVGGRTFAAEAVAGAPDPTFYLFELEGDTVKQLASPKGTFDPADGFVKMLVPLADIGAKKGMRISGVGAPGTEDVDTHIHMGVTDYKPDAFATARDFVVP